MTAKRQLAQDLAGQAPVRVVCRALALPPSSYYYAPRGTDDLTVLGWIEEVLVDFPTYGYRRLTAELARRGHALNHKRIQRLLRQHDLVRPVRRGGGHHEQPAPLRAPRQPAPGAGGRATRAGVVRRHHLHPPANPVQIGRASWRERV